MENTLDKAIPILQTVPFIPDPGRLHDIIRGRKTCPTQSRGGISACPFMGSQWQRLQLTVKYHRANGENQETCNLSRFVGVRLHQVLDFGPRSWEGENRVKCVLPATVAGKSDKGMCKEAGMFMKKHRSLSKRHKLSLVAAREHALGKTSPPAKNSWAEPVYVPPRLRYPTTTSVTSTCPCSFDARDIMNEENRDEETLYHTGVHANIPPLESVQNAPISEKVQQEIATGGTFLDGRVSREARLSCTGPAPWYKPRHWPATPARFETAEKGCSMYSPSRGTPEPISTVLTEMRWPGGGNDVKEETHFRAGKTERVENLPSMSAICAHVFGRQRPPTK
ncbi:hypothetical protein Bbelb_401950 [Branchiostoma belcheri]|nr:hypothetical protein Bbelb_401950 [Branchiostoma belcheri]